MAKKRTSKINGALDMQRELEELFFLAKKTENIKQAAYLAQVWASLESHASLERKRGKEERTALDDLVDILGELRSNFNNNEKEDFKNEK